MALKTLKQGHVHVLLDGSQRPWWNAASASGGGVTVCDDANGDPLIFYSDSADLRKKTGNHVLTPSDLGSDGSVVFNQTHAIVNPVVYRSSADPTNLWLWYAYDSAGGAARTVYFTYSTDSGANWQTPAEVVALGAGATWNDAALKPVGVHHDTTNEVLHLFVQASDNLATWQLGHWTVDTSSGTLTTVLASSGNYIADSGNPVHFGDSSSATYVGVGFHKDRYHLYYGDDGSPTVVYYRSTENPSDWTGEGSLNKQAVVLGSYSSGIDTQQIQPNPPFVYEGRFYLPYVAYNGTAYKFGIAVGDEGDRLFKVGGMHNLDALSDSSKYTLTASESEVYWATGDLTYEFEPRGRHILDRGNPGYIQERVQVDFSGSFSFRNQIMDSSDVGESKRPLLWKHMMEATPNVSQTTAGQIDDTSVPRCHVLYRVEDESGNDSNFHLFLNCHFNNSISEDEDGMMVNANFTCYGTHQPIWGVY